MSTFETPAYHPVVETNIVTRGIDAGRIANSAWAMAQAEDEQYAHMRARKYGDTFPDTAERVRGDDLFQRKLEQGLEIKIATLAILQAEEHSTLPPESVESIARCAVLSLLDMEREHDVPDIDSLYNRDDPINALQVAEGLKAVESHSLLLRNVARQNASIVGNIRNVLLADG